MLKKSHMNEKVFMFRKSLVISFLALCASCKTANTTQSEAKEVGSASGQTVAATSCMKGGDPFPNPTFPVNSLVTGTFRPSEYLILGYVLGSRCLGGYEDVVVCTQWPEVYWRRMSGLRPTSLRALKTSGAATTCPMDVPFDQTSDDQKIACINDTLRRAPSGCRTSDSNH